MLRMLKINYLRRLRSGQSGLTLVETAVALAILSMGVTLVGSGVFQVLSIQRFWQDDRVATKDNRHAASWFAGDALRASEVLQVDGTSLSPEFPVVNGEVTLVVDTGNVTYYAHCPTLDCDTSDNQYTLIRQAAGSENVVATRVESVEFSRSPEDGKVLTLTLEVEAARGGTETLILHNYLRMAQ
jgi:hypothetical protein